MDSVDDITSMFDAESKKLENLISTAATKSDLSLHQIIEIYYQIMNVSSMIIMLKQQINANEHQILLNRIIEIDQVISNKFNSIIHPAIIEQLTQSIKDITKNLQSVTSEQKSKEDIENDAKLYEELRKKMSTKEFVEQYDKGLSDD